MAYDHTAVMNRDQNRCRLRFPGCLTHATKIMLDVPEFIGGMSTDVNALAACRHCATEQQQQRDRAAALFGYSTEGR